MGGACVDGAARETECVRVSPPRQLPKAITRELFDYRDGKLYWRHRSSGRRPDMLALRPRGRYGYRVVVGDEWYRAEVLIWNWHNGQVSGRIIPKDGNPLNTAIENLQHVQNFIKPRSSQCALSACPVCDQPVAAPTYDFLVLHLDIPPLQARILRAIWDGNGHPVMPTRIFDYMYSDEDGGGPSEAAMYSALKVALSRLRDRLKGSGVSVETVGYRQGYRIKFGEQ